MSNLNETGYYSLFNGKEEKALERAWQNRDFEIEKYWSRATYFWAFIAATFAGYIAIVSSDNLDKIKKMHLPFILICIGIVFSVAWVLVNYGSKKWQENWEKHIDMLEDRVTGPLYKVVLKRNTYSVSKINILMSYFVTGVWVSLAGQYLVTENLLCCCGVPCKAVFIIWLSIVGTLAMISIMLWGYGRTTGSSKSFSFFLRQKDMI